MSAVRQWVSGIALTMGSLVVASPIVAQTAVSATDGVNVDTSSLKSRVDVLDQHGLQIARGTILQNRSPIAFLFFGIPHQGHDFRQVEQM